MILPNGPSIPHPIDGDDALSRASDTPARADGSTGDWGMRGIVVNRRGGPEAATATGGRPRASDTPARADGSTGDWGMRAIVVNRPGGPEAFTTTEVDRPRPDR